MKKRIYLAAFLAVAMLLAFLFRLELLFTFQRMRLPKSDKLWAHRVNSRQRFNYLTQYFPGVEADAVFDKAIDNFRIYHPPAEPAALTLDVYLKAHKKLWIDIKGLDTAEYIQALQYFKRCDSLYRIKTQIIIETGSVPFANMLAQQGFTASWMMPVNEKEIQSSKAALSPQVRYVSQEDRHIPLLKKHFPNHKIITWALSFNNYFNRSHFNELIADSSIQVILVNCKSKGHI